MSGPDIAGARLKAQGGDPRAQYELACYLLLHAPQALAEPMQMLDAACRKDYADALRLHAALATLGLGRSRNLNDAIDLLARAAAKGDKLAKGQLDALGGVKGFDASFWHASPAVQQHCDAPRLFTIANLVPPAACAWLIEISREGQTAASAIEPEAGYASGSRHTHTAAEFHAIEPDVVLQLVRLRIAAVTGLPLMHLERPNVLRYTAGQEYAPHFDYIRPERAAVFAGELEQIGQRIGTFLVYLNDNYEGGETAFPRLGSQIRGRTGDALLFWNTNARGEVEPNSLHAGLPVLKGEKWVLSQWMRARPVPLLYAMNV